MSAPPLTHLHVLKLPFMAMENLLEAIFELDHAAGFLSDGGALGRWSWLCAGADSLSVLDYNDTRAPAEILGAALKTARSPTLAINGDAEDLPPFTGGLAGYLSFELGARLENLKPRPFRVEGRGAWPEMVVLRFPSVLAFDHQTRRLLALGRGRDEAEAHNRALAMQKRLHQSLARASPYTAPQAPLREPLALETPDQAHETRVASLIRQIHAGDLFQANLARGWRGELAEGKTPGQVLKALQRHGPSPFGGALRLQNRVILSNSPERFIALSADGRLETRPIKGTRPRGTTPETDRRLAEALLSSDKDRAENLMIVDLMRHDLSKVSQPGSVRVTTLNGLESYANVHHLVSVVTAQLAEGFDAGDVLLKSFPPGSVSGAPKVQAMKVIADLEAPRGPYCGAMFYVDASGSMDSSVLIRTMVMEQDEAQVWHVRACAGGGIVADSDPVAERIETETKLSLIRKVLEAGPEAKR